MATTDIVFGQQTITVPVNQVPILSTAGVSTRCEMFGAAPSATASENLSAIQSALNVGGIVTLNTAGTFLLSDSLIIYSNTHFRIGPNTILKMQDSAGGKPVIKNDAYNRRAAADTITLAWSSGITASISGWVGHGLTTNDYVWMQGATLSVYNTIARVTAADSAAGTATVRLMYVPSGAVSGTITALKCDRNIIIEGGYADYNYPSNTTGVTPTLDACGINIGVAQNVKLINAGSGNGQKYAFNTGAIRDLQAFGCFTKATASDFFKVLGPAINCTINGASGSIGDDGVSFQVRQPSAYPNFQWSNGDVINCHAEGLDLETSLAGSAVAVAYPSDTEMMTVSFKNINGYAPTGKAVKVVAEHSASDRIKSLRIDKAQNGGGNNVLHINRVSTNGIIIDDLQATQLIENGLGVPQAVVLMDAGCYIKNGLIDIVVQNSAFTGGQYAMQLNGNYNRLQVTGSIEGGGTARGIQLGGDVKTGNLIVSMSQLTGDQLVGGTLSGTITLDGCTTQIANVVSATSVSGTINVNLQGNLFTNASGGVVRSSAGTFNVRSAGDNNFAGTSVPVLAPSGTPTFNLYGNDLKQDLTATGTTKTTSGQYCFNTAAAAGTIAQNRLVTCNGTNWIQVDDSTKLY